MWQLCIFTAVDRLQVPDAILRKLEALDCGSSGAWTSGHSTMLNHLKQKQVVDTIKVDMLEKEAGTHMPQFTCRMAISLQNKTCFTIVGDACPTKKSARKTAVFFAIGEVLRRCRCD